MAYADPLDETAPAGNTKVKLGDDAIRTAIRAIRQRLSSIMVDIDADPMVLKDGIIKTSQIIDANITQAKLAKPAVGTPEVFDRNITGVKIALDAIIQEHIGAGLFSFDDLNSAAGLTIAGAAVLGKILKGDGAHFIPADLSVADFPSAELQKLVHYHTGWRVDNVPGGSASFMNKYGILTGAIEDHADVMTQAGEVRALWVRGNADRTAGSFTVQITKNGVAVGGAIATIDAANVRWAVALLGGVNFVAGDYIGISWASVGLTPAGSTEYFAGFEARYT